MRQSRYSKFGGELLAVHLVVRRIRHALEGCPLKVFTAHKQLVYALLSASDWYRSRKIRHLYLVSKFFVEIQNASGADNPVTDAFFRMY